MIEPILRRIDERWPAGGDFDRGPMIAKVKIAPIDRWCAGALQKLSEKPAHRLLVGQECEIDTEKMTLSPVCFGRAGQLRPESIKKLSEITGMKPIGPVGAFCEHFLEMD